METLVIAIIVFALIFSGSKKSKPKKDFNKDFPGGGKGSPQEGGKK